MANLTRPRLAQLCLAGAVAALLLRWQTGAADTASGAGSATGFGVSDGTVILLASLITIALIQVKFRPAWCGAGFVVAVSGRAIVVLSGSGPPDLGIGPVIVACAATIAAALLLWELFASVGRNAAPAANGDDR